MKTDQDKVRCLLSETIIKLCTESVAYNHTLSVEGLLAVTVDSSDIVLVHINKKLTPRSGFNNEETPLGQDEETRQQTKHQQGRHVQPPEFVSSDDTVPSPRESDDEEAGEIPLKVTAVRSISDTGLTLNENSTDQSKYNAEVGDVRRSCPKAQGNNVVGPVQVPCSEPMYKVNVLSKKQNPLDFSEVSRRKYSIPVKVTQTPRNSSNSGEILPANAIKTEVTSDDEDHKNSGRAEMGWGGGRLGSVFGLGAVVSEKSPNCFSSPASSSGSQDDVVALRQSYTGLGLSLNGNYAGYAFGHGSDEDMKPVGVLSKVQERGGGSGAWQAACSLPSAAAPSPAAGVNTLAVSALTWPHATQAALGMPGHIGLQMPAISTLLAPIRLTNAQGESFSSFQQVNGVTSGVI